MSKKDFAKTYHEEVWVGELQSEEQYERLKKGEIDFKEHIKPKIKTMRIPASLFYKLMETDKQSEQDPSKSDLSPICKPGDKAYFVIEDTNETYIAEEPITDVSTKGFFVNGEYELNLYSDIGKSTTIEAFERKLLRGEAFSEVKAIERSGLNELFELIKSGVTGIEYKPKTVFSESGKEDETAFLTEQHKKKQVALERLKAIYLYDDSGVSESEYVSERQKLIKEIEEIESRLLVLNASLNQDSVDEEYQARASYFIMAEKLINGQYLDFEKEIKSIDKSIPRLFFQQIIKSIYLVDGRITSIEFTNGIVHKFLYS